MLYLLSLISLLAVLAGIIAYAGDVLGTTIGKRRLSLFGWRPKRTGQVVGVAVGILIMLTTLGILMVAFRGAAGVLLRAQRTFLRLEELQSEQLALQSEVKSLEARARELESRNAVLEANNSELLGTNGELQQKNLLLEEQNGFLEDTMGALYDQITVLEDQVRELQALVERQAQQVTEVRSELSVAEPIYRRGEIIWSGVIAASEPSAIREAFSSLVQEANGATLRRGAGTVSLRNDQVSGLIEAVMETAGEDVVVLSSPTDQLGQRDVLVEVTAYENRQLLVRGQLVTSKQLYLGAERSQGDMRNALAGLIAEATARLQRLGLFEGQRPELVTLSEETFIAQLSRLKGPVVIGLLAAEAVYSSGPARLELVILR